jgi:4-diphosphocytidyl-2-C-methyl-D-erythritol kinase
MMKEAVIKAYGKVNLSLEVLGRRSDGYHDIRSFMQDIDICDIVRVSIKSDNSAVSGCFIDGIKIEFCTDNDTIPEGADNLAVKGAAAVLGKLREGGYDLSELENGALGITVEKHLPVAAGLAGGSGNAAAVILAVNKLLGSPLTLRELMDSGLSAGADVPFSTMMIAAGNRPELADLTGIDEASNAAVVEGIGDIVTPADPVPYSVILMNPGVSVSTKEVYEELDKIRNSFGETGEGLDRGGQSARKQALFHNDMEAYTLEAYGEAGELKAAMEQHLTGAAHILMSGSGPTIAAYYTDAGRASNEFADKAWKKDTWREWLTRTGGTKNELRTDPETA